jgi:acetyltransferase-like isoleucine patch superfamily enzyme
VEPVAEPEINAAQLRRGEDLQCGARVQIGAIGGSASVVHIGDNVFIGDDVRILAPRVHIGDFCVIHNHTTIYGYDSFTLGACSWVGQQAILNCTAPLTIGRGCTISALSTLWTHFAGGDTLEGCNFNHRRSCTIGDDAWIGVQCSVAPVHLGARALVLAGSVVTRDIPPNRCYGGNPAADLTDKLGAPYTVRSPQEKFELLCDRLRDYHASLHPTGEPAGLGAEQFRSAPENGVFHLGGITVTMVNLAEDGSSIFDVRNRSYSKLRTPEEIGFMHFLLPVIKFYPRTEEFR